MGYLRRAVHSLSLFVFSITLISANRHTATSADPVTSQLDISYLNETISLKLNAPGTIVEKYADGQLRFISFYKMETLYKVAFHPEKRFGKELVASVQQFKIVGHTHIPEGTAYAFSRDGLLICEAHWKEGRLHGPYKVYNNQGQLIEEKSFQDGQPIGNWTLYYANGNRAKTINFPETAASWQANPNKVKATGRHDEATLMTIPYRQAISAIEVWYSEEGQKVKEIHHRLHKPD